MAQIKGDGTSSSGKKTTTIKDLQKTANGVGVGVSPTTSQPVWKPMETVANLINAVADKVTDSKAGTGSAIGTPNALPNGTSPIAGKNMSQILSDLPGGTSGGTSGGAYQGSSGSNGVGSSVTPATAVASLAIERMAQDRAMMSQSDWQTKYGNINFDANTIRSIFDTATQAEYAAKRREYDATERKFYDQLGTAQNSQLAARRQAAAQNAVLTGANRGMQNAMLLTDTLQQSAATAPDALALAEGRRALIDQEQAALTANAKEAEALAEQRKLDYAKVGSEIYATDAQKYVGELGYDVATFEAAINKYGVDRAYGAAYQALGPTATTAEKRVLDKGMYQKLYNAAQASGDTATAQMAASMLGLLALQG